jgi:hypothetical protein
MHQQKVNLMTGRNLRTARATLGKLYGLGRPLKASELGRLLRMPGRDPGRSVLDWEYGKYPLNGPAAVAVEALLGGFRPGHFAEAIR